MCLWYLFSAKTASQLVNRKADFFLQNESIRIDSHNESNRIDSNRELECSSNMSMRLYDSMFFFRLYIIYHWALGQRQQPSTGFREMKLRWSQWWEVSDKLWRLGLSSQLCVFWCGNSSCRTWWAEFWIRLNNTSSESSTSCTATCPSTGYSPARAPRRTTASMRLGLRSSAVVNLASSGAGRVQ